MSKTYLELANDSDLRNSLSSAAATFPDLLDTLDALEDGITTSTDLSTRHSEHIALRAQFEHGSRSILRQLRVLMTPKKSKDEPVTEPIPWGELKPD